MAKTPAIDPDGELRKLFGDNRAEWHPRRFGELFVEPAYFARLEAVRPSLLVGGRGTGKTTALRSLRFDATLDRLRARDRSFSDQIHVGVFVRINKNRVHAFRGPELGEDEWGRAFAHYFNLAVSREMARLAEWLQLQQQIFLSEEDVGRIAMELGFTGVSALAQLDSALSEGMSRLQLFVNNVGSIKQPILSLADAPLRTFVDVLSQRGLLEDRTVFCCIDEYENLLPSQQAVLNTYIKHAEPPLSYKVGVRKNGLKTHHTTDGSDVLEVPNDYQEIEIESEGFDHFATAVADLRLRRARSLGVDVPERIAEFLEDLSLAEEAKLLGAKLTAQKVRAELESSDSPLALWFDSLPESDGYFLQYWAESVGQPVAELAREWQQDEARWQTRLSNYRYASLFWLSAGRKGARIRKYYCGLGTILILSGGNIRYFLELVDCAIGEELGSDKKPVGGTNFSLSPKSQTRAAKEVGRRRLNQLEGLAEHGVELKRLVLAVGKVFFELARSPLGRTPEVTSFVLSGGGQTRMQIQELLGEGVAHLAFQATPRTKATSNSEMRDDEYRLHPIFCAFFEISHRRKRRTTFSADHLQKVLDTPNRAISLLLEGSSQTKEDELPDQLAFFSAFFGNGGNG